MYLHCKWHFWLTSATLHKLQHFFAFLLYLVRVDLGYDMTWVQLDRGYEITWVRVDLVRVNLGYELTVNPLKSRVVGGLSPVSFL